MSVACGVALPETVLLNALTAVICDPLAPRRQSRLEPRAVGQMGTFLHWVQSLWTMQQPLALSSLCCVSA